MKITKTFLEKASPIIILIIIATVMSVIIAFMYKGIKQSMVEEEVFFQNTIPMLVEKQNTLIEECKRFNQDFKPVYRYGRNDEKKIINIMCVPKYTAQDVTGDVIDAALLLGTGYLIYGLLK
jgi:hypothetical protein